ncbi:MAG: hypothetical protein K9G46_09650 [Flavobacteriales bacterium]|nr:hypothetical protein [Flavobacteriales bacterium]
MIDLKDTRKKHWIFFGLTGLGAVAVIMLIGYLFWSDMSEEEKAMTLQLHDRFVIYTAVALGIMLLISSQFILYIFRNYIAPIEKLIEETRLITVANAKYRIKPEGATETHDLTAVINELADSYITLKTDVRNIVKQSQAGFDVEKKRLETLMSQIPEGVVVCNYDGRILLFNHQAHKLFSSDDVDDENTDAGMLGLGRSIFGICNRNPIIHALNFLQNRLNEGQNNPTFNFITIRKGTQFLRVNMAVVLASEEDDAVVSGYVLTFSDITHEIISSSQRDIFLQSLTIGLQSGLGQIAGAAKTLANNPKLKGEFSSETDTIKMNVDGILAQIDQIAVQHANRLDEPKDTEFILSNELIQMLVEDIRKQFNIDVRIDIEEGLWLQIASYTIIRGVMYFLGQLTNHVDIGAVDLALHKQDDNAVLKLVWEGRPIQIKTILEWKQCPLMTQAKKKDQYSFSSLLIGEDENTELQLDDMATSVRFQMPVQKPESNRSAEHVKNSRPVYYELDLFSHESQSTDLDDMLLSELSYVVFDTETTGLDPSGGDEIISIAGVRIINGKLHSEDTFDQLVNPKRNIPLVSLKIHEIYPEMLADKPTIDKILPRFYRYAENSVLVAHNASFDMRFLQIKEEQTGVRFTNPVLDTLLLSAVCHPKQELHNMEDISERLGIELVGRHTALGDSIVTAEILLKLIPILEAKGIKTLRQAREESMKTSYARISF